MGSALLTSMYVLAFIGLFAYKSECLNLKALRIYSTEDEYGRRLIAAAPAPSPSQKRKNDSRNNNDTDSDSDSALAPSPGWNESQRRHKKVSSKKWAYGLVLGIVTGAFSALFSCFVFRALVYYIRGRSKASKTKIYSAFIKKADDLAFLETEDALKSAIMIGKGGCGEVYKAELPDGKEIAIKKIFVAQGSSSRGDVSDEDSKLLNRRKRSIRAELDTLAQVRHRNLVVLLAYVPRKDCPLLVYEYMSNGSVKQAMDRVAEGTLELPWAARRKIALGIASGLEYLHFQSRQKIVHRDLKPANILLDDDFDPKVADFGLAKAVPDADSHATTSNVAGTVGYIAPEYHQTLKFTDKCDIYSFGVVLTFLFTGKEPSDESFQNNEREGTIILWLRNIVASGDVSKAIDPQLRGQGFDDQICLMLKIACFCTYDDPSQRPSSRDLVHMIAQITV